MLKVERKVFEKVVVRIVTSTDLRELIGEFSPYRVFFYSLLRDISKGKGSPNYHVLKKIARERMISEQFIIEQAKLVLSHFAPDNPRENYYQTLHVSPIATAEEIRKSWLNLMKTYHPDNVGEQGLDITKKLNEAYDVLGDPVKRNKYDVRRLPELPILVSCPWMEINSRKFVYLSSLLAVVIFASVFYLTQSDLSPRSDKKRGDFVEKVEKKQEYKLLGVKQLTPAKLEIEKNKVVSSPLKEKVLVARSAGLTEFSAKEEKEALPPYLRPEQKSEEEEPLVQKQEEFSSSELQSSEFSSAVDRESAQGQAEQEPEVPEKADIFEERKVGSVEERESEPRYVVNKPELVSRPDEASLYSSLYSFVSEYVSAYKNRDIDKFMSFFELGARENGVEISKTISSYTDNFSSLEIIRYDVRINRIDFKDSGASTGGDFVVIFRNKNAQEIKRANGTINWFLSWQGNMWKIKEVNYRIKDMKSFKDSRAYDVLENNS